MWKSKNPEWKNCKNLKIQREKFVKIEKKILKREKLVKIEIAGEKKLYQFKNPECKFV